MSITVKTTNTSRYLCGFCSSGHHENCPGGVLNGNQTEVVICPCDCESPKLRCLNCNAREDINAETWSCNDIESCNATQAKRRAQAHRDLYGATADGEPLRAVPVKDKAPKAPPKARTGACLHCDAPTKGGMFAPGHDAAFLAAAVKLINDPESERTLEETLAAWEGWGISEALRAKLTKRVAS